MNRGDYAPYVWQSPDWPKWRHDLAALAAPLAAVSHAQGSLHGRLADLGLGLRDHARVDSLADEVIKTSAIEGERLDADTVRSSVARRLGVDIGALAPVDRDVEGVVDLVLDATTRFEAPLTLERLFGWHAALFPTGHSGAARITVGALRDDAHGPMQVVSGPVHRQRVHFEAPPAERLADELTIFLDWVNGDGPEQPLIKAGLAHLWFVTLHPFDDGNGRVGRAIGDMLLARAEGSAQRFYSLSAQIQRERSGYYAALERAQRGTLDATAWLAWFLETLHQAVASSHTALEGILFKAHFWQRWGAVPMNDRQVKLLNRLLDGFEGNMTTGKWAAIARCSPDTALRDIQALVTLGVLRQTGGGGRSTGYTLNRQA